ncbi:hypothetical protein AVEN_205063-1 [Araneus ventricosus]|uniref:Uncharacterized protein n=1 Tax=Araneus ventricosus TaxID=182803 RepID=A0A4Y2ITG5_ARAVE|nr:hypothetical protein AVEN_205063-1 [Araneus ventricosus]
MIIFGSSTWIHTPPKCSRPYTLAPPRYGFLSSSDARDRSSYNSWSYSQCSAISSGEQSNQNVKVNLTEEETGAQAAICHIDPMRNRKTPLLSSYSSPETQENSTIPAVSSAIPSSSTTPIKPTNPPAEIETSKKAPDVSHQNRPG